MSTNFADTITFLNPVVFKNTVQFDGGNEPVFSLANIDSLDISGGIVAAGSGQFGNDLSCTDDLTVGDDASVGGDLAVTGAVTGDTAYFTGTLDANGDTNIGGAFRGFGSGQFDSGFTVFGATTLQATECSTLEATGAVLCGSTVGITGAVTMGSSLAVAGTSTLHNTSIIGTLGVSSTSTLAATTTTALTATTSITLTGASVIGLHEHVTLDVPTLVGTGVYGLPCPVAGTITKVQTRLKAPLTTGDATLTAKIGATGVTNGVVTITQSGSAIGDIDVANPTAANTVSVGSNLSVTVGGTNDAVVGATVVFSILRSA